MWVLIKHENSRGPSPVSPVLVLRWILWRTREHSIKLNFDGAFYNRHCSKAAFHESRWSLLMSATEGDSDRKNQVSKENPTKNMRKNDWEEPEVLSYVFMTRFHRSTGSMLYLNRTAMVWKLLSFQCISFFCFLNHWQETILHRTL